MYQRLGLEDDIVDPSNTLLREGPVLKISFRRSGPMERYLFLVRRCLGGPLAPHWGGESTGMGPLPQVLPPVTPTLWGSECTFVIMGAEPRVAELFTTSIQASNLVCS